MNQKTKNLDQFYEVKYKESSVPIGKINSLNGNGRTCSKNTDLRYKAKFNRILKLANSLDDIVNKLKNLLESSKDIKQKQSAFSILMMIETGIRVGNESSAEGYICKVKNHELFEKEIKTYGLTTLLKEHLNFLDDSLEINFTGKKGVSQSIVLKDKYLLDWSKRFFEISENTWLNIDAKDLIFLIRKKIGKNYTIKDFRTLKACLEAAFEAKIISQKEIPKTKKEFVNEIKSVCLEVSNHLGNTPGICKTSYINPEIFEWMALSRFPQYLEIVKKKRKKKKKIIKNINEEVIQK